MVMLTNNGKKDGNSSRIFGKWKKGHGSPKKQVKSVSFAKTTSPPYEKSSTRSCLNTKKYNDIDKEIDMVPIDSRDPQVRSKRGSGRPPTTSKASSSQKTSQKKKSPRNEKTVGTKIYSANSAETKIKTNKNKTQKKNRDGVATSSMMTPDMMETLGLVELRQDDPFLRETPKHGNASNSAQIRNLAIEQTSRNKAFYDKNPGSTAVIRAPATAALAQPGRSNRRNDRLLSDMSYEYNDNESTFYFGDSDTITRTSGSGTSYSSNFSDDSDDEPISRDPCPSYCYVADDGDDSSNYENTRRMNLFRNVDGNTCGPMACVSMVLSLPVACGLLCVDNVLNTKFFDAATDNYRKSPTHSLPDPMSKSMKRKIKTRNHRGNMIPDSDDDDEEWNVCDVDLFPSEDATHRNTGPCW